MNRKTLPGVALMAGTSLLGAVMLVLAVPGAHDVPEDAAALYRGGAPAKCFTTPPANCPIARATCAGTSCTEGIFRYYCPAGSVDEIQAAITHPVCQNVSAGFATCVSGPGAGNNNGTMCCVSNRACQFNPDDKCDWDAVAMDFRCKQDLTNPVNTPAQFYLPLVGGTCP